MIKNQIILKKGSWAVDPSKKVSSKTVRPVHEQDSYKDDIHVSKSYYNILINMDDGTIQKYFNEGKPNRSRLDGLTSFLKENANLISEQQGYLKDVQDIRVVIRYLDRSFVPRKYLSDPNLFKKANKLLCALKQYLFNTFGGENIPVPSLRYKNLFTDFKLLGDVKPKVPLREILELEGDIPMSTSTYLDKPKLQIAKKYRRIKVPKNVKRPFLQKARMEAREMELVRDQQGKKKSVDKNIIFNVKLIKNAKTIEEKNEMLYQIYLNWFDKKREANNRYCEIMRKYKFGPRVMQEDVKEKAYKKYYCSKDMMIKYLSENIWPKRFSRIFKFLKDLNERKPIRNSTVVDSIISDVLIKKNPEKKGAWRTEKPNMKFRYNADFVGFITAVQKDLVRRGYLKYILFDLSNPAMNHNAIFSYDKYKPILTRQFQLDKARWLNVINQELNGEPIYPFIKSKLKNKVRKMYHDPKFVRTLRKNMMELGYTTEYDIAIPEHLDNYSGPDITEYLREFYYYKVSDVNNEYFNLPPEDIIKGINAYHVHKESCYKCFEKPYLTDYCDNYKMMLVGTKKERKTKVFKNPKFIVSEFMRYEKDFFIHEVAKILDSTEDQDED